MTVVLQVSDPHFGTEQPQALVALQRLSARLRPDLLLVTGDITQRATRAQFASARAAFESLHIPAWQVIPGNHDIPLFDLAARALHPYGRFQQAFGTALEGEDVVGRHRELAQAAEKRSPRSAFGLETGRSNPAVGVGRSPFPVEGDAVDHAITVEQVIPADRRELRVRTVAEKGAPQPFRKRAGDAQRGDRQLVVDRRVLTSEPRRVVHGATLASTERRLATTVRAWHRDPTAHRLNASASSPRPGI